MRAFTHLLVACFLALLVGILFSLRDARFANAQGMPPSCDDLSGAIADALQYDVCSTTQGSACYLHTDVIVTAKPQRSIDFSECGDTAQLADLRSLTTRANAGAVYLLGGTYNNPVKIVVFGDSTLKPQQGKESGVFKLRCGSQGPVCERARSGMVLRTPTNMAGTIVVNGVTIRLRSTAYVAAGADLLFDQDPRIDRRRGSRNYNAPLCSGFDSDCEFGDSRCSTEERLVWGPFCRKDIYPYIENGLYRVTLYGGGSVAAGVTDYGSTGDHFSLAYEELALPGTYTFCWDGLVPGGTGFETIVRPLREGAYVDRITLEYLGRDCDLPTAPVSAERAPLGVMTVYNVEGNVQVEAAGAVRNLQPRQRVRVYFDGDRPTAIDPVPLPATYVLSSPLVEWVQGQTVTPPSEPASVSFWADETSPVEGACTTLHWDVEHVRAVYLDGDGVDGHDSMEVCPAADQTYVLRVAMPDGSEQVYNVVIDVVEQGRPFLQVMPKVSMDGGELNATATVEFANGDSIEAVRFSIIDSNGNEVYGNSGRRPPPGLAEELLLNTYDNGTAGYCMFMVKGAVGCTTYGVYDNSLLWPDRTPITSGEFTLRVYARTQSGISAESDAGFTMPFLILYNGPSGYASCANEGQRCSFSGTKDVAFGANGSFNYLYGVIGGIDCSNSEFGDPVYGTVKACYVSGGDGPSAYVLCANENQWCVFDGTKDVAFGANGSFNYQYGVTRAIKCSNSEFGDPIYGTVKACYTK